MDQMIKQLKAREKYLLHLKQEKERALKNAPEGSLRLCIRGDKTQYYQRNNPKDFCGIYIRQKDTMLARKLAQKDYDQKVLAGVEKELNAIKKYLAACPVIRIEQLYADLHKERQKLVEPIVEPEEQYVYNWEKVTYQGKKFDEDMPEIYTARGERVRSKSEVIIADILYGEGIPYRYEYPIHLKDWGRVYPDFTVLNTEQRKEIYWEHLGMMDDLGYVENALQKIVQYEQNGIFPGDNLILTYETRKNPINPQIIKLMIRQYLKNNNSPS